MCAALAVACCAWLLAVACCAWLLAVHGCLLCMVLGVHVNAHVHVTVQFSYVHARCCVPCLSFVTVKTISKCLSEYSW